MHKNTISNLFAATDLMDWRHDSISRFDRERYVSNGMYYISAVGCTVGAKFTQ